MNLRYLSNFAALLLLKLALASSKKRSKVKEDDEYAFPDNKARVLELYLPYRLDFYSEMKLTTIFPRKFLYTLQDYQKTKNAGKPIISMPNVSSGAISLGVVHIPDRRVLLDFYEMMDDLTKRVFRTGLNDQTVGGNFRLAMFGMGIETDTRHVYARFDPKYPTDSYSRYITFMKSLYYRLSRLGLRYELYGDIKLDQFVLGRVEDLNDINLKAFDKQFRDFMVGFVTFSKILAVPPDCPDEKMKSVFYFDYTSHEPIIGIENTLDGDGFEGGIDGKGTGRRSPEEKSKEKPKLNRPAEVKKSSSKSDSKKTKTKKK